jgi:Holliday junction resolvasome RuvABC endonuclease subunit
MRILALDPATRCGFAYSSRPTLSGTWDLSTRRDESGSMKLVRLRSKLEEFKRLGVDLIVFEAARNAMPKMQGALVHQAKLQAVIELFAEDHAIAYRGYSPAELKKFATGKGNANKAAMVAAISARYGPVSDDNEADAIALLHLALSEYASVTTSKVQAAEPASLLNDDDIPF